MGKLLAMALPLTHVKGEGEAVVAGTECGEARHAACSWGRQRGAVARPADGPIA